MTCDLDRIFTSLAATLCQASEGSFRLSQETVPPLSTTSLTTDRLVIEKRYSAYDAVYRRDLLVFYAEKAVYCHLGLLVAAALFAPSAADVVLHLTHAASNVRRIVVRRNDAADLDSPGFHSQPYVLNYYPEVTTRHPWEPFCGSPHDLPGFFLTDADELVRTDADWEKRDTVIGFGSDRGMARFIELRMRSTNRVPDVGVSLA